ncbi:MAG TPA: DUF5695 domain-containing protein [Fimbriimonadaceae bacterium]|nr:DUF5695 domain-containing protein [Fimbriimonadaceae bacterium]
MDPFSDERHELTGVLISMEFGPGGRIVQLWAADPMLPDEGEDFQFVLPPLSFGEENAEDLYPGTILLSARTDPNGPWISSRNQSAEPLLDLDREEAFEADKVSFEYEFPFLEDVQSTGRFYEVPGAVPHVVWDLELRNRGRVTVEIGELGFPLALNCFYDGFGWSDEQLKRLWNSRLYIHKFIGGAASWVFAQRMTAEPPGLLIIPGDQTGWEFFNHIPASLSTPHQWEGIPVVYAHSRATMEREGWESWANEHTSLILEPGDTRSFQMRFIPTERDKQDTIFQTLSLLRRPAIKLLPSAVAPVDVGIAVEVAGVAPARFFVSRDATVETDFDEEGGFCFVRPREPGPLRVTIEDREGRLSHAHLMFTEPIESLIRKRADYILRNQVHRLEGRFDKAILLTNIVDHEQVTEADEYEGASGIECSLADALFLAEKNANYPDRIQIRTLDEYIEDFLLEQVQNPGDMSVASALGDGTSLGVYAGRPLTYPDVVSLYHAMYRIASTYGETLHAPKVYLDRAVRTVLAMFRFGWRHYVRTVGLLGYARVYSLLGDLRREGLHEDADRLQPLIDMKAREIVKQQYPYAGESVLDTSGFEEVFHAALYLDNDEHLERTMRCAYAARSLAPSWWWYGSDKRSWDGADSTPIRALVDRGEACLAHTTMPNSLLFLESLDRDYLAIPDAYMRLAFGGMMGPWALIRQDGGASMCFCPDLSSKHYGYNAFTGASGLGYFHYLRGAGSYVLPNKGMGVFAFGCHLAHDNGILTVRPWDGIGRRIILRQIGAEFELGFGKFIEFKMDARKRWVTATIQNPSDKDIRTEWVMRGLWGSQVQSQGKVWESHEGEVRVALLLPANETIEVEAKVVR